MGFPATPKSSQLAAVFQHKTPQIKSFQLNDFPNNTFQIHANQTKLMASFTSILSIANTFNATRGHPPRRLQFCQNMTSETLTGRVG